ncbi:hypothetical protein GE061_014744 [Apolygus lucorum]|uniref:Cuticle protein 6 n=1 Tax=Apolygus lucorum TaxID=248454 RepID=A0A8S9XL47_APOLU|nr:hypothetical protein GE061_014744 [Apolygus lucorum]
MKRFCVLLLAVGLARGGRVALEHVGQITSQYHSQDELGQYSYGYAGGPSAKEEIKTADGITRGGYSYIDANGIVQSAAYVSDPVNGFRVAATNLPAGPAVPAGPSVVAASPAVVAAPVAAVAPAPVLAAAPVAAVAPAPVLAAAAPAWAAAAPAWAAEPAVVAAPAPIAIAEAPAVTATNVQEVAGAAADVPVAADLPEIVAARSLPTVVASRAAIAHPLAATSWSGIVHHLKKRSTAPLVHAAPVVAAPVISAHSGLVAAPAVAGWPGLVHALRKRSVLIPSALVASPYLAGPYEPLHTAVLRQAHEVTKAQEALRNTAGVIPLNSPADTPDVEITKVNHVLQVAAEGQRNTLGGIHYLRKRSIWAPSVVASPLIASPYLVGAVGPVEPLHTAVLRQAHEVTKAQEALRNTAGVIPLNSPADTPDVEITKVNHVLQVAAEGQRNTLGGIHYLRKRSIWAPSVVASPLIASPYLVGAVGPVEPLHTAVLRQAHEVTKAQEALRNTAGVIPLNSPADTPDVEITKVNHVLQVAAEGQRNTLGGIHYLRKRSIWAPSVVASPLIASPYLVGAVGPIEPLHTAVLRQAHEVTKAQEALRNTAGVIPLNSPADTPDVEITKVNHVLQVAAEGQRNTLGGIPVISSHPVVAHL